MALNVFKRGLAQFSLFAKGRRNQAPANTLATTIKRTVAHIPAAQVTREPSSANAIQTPDIARKLVTRYGIREKNPTPTVSPEVVPVVLVDDLIGESDIIVPRIRPASGFGAIAPVAQTCAVQLQNPAGSNTILHVYYVILSSSLAVDIFARSHGIIDALPIAGGSAGFRNTLLANQITVGQCAAAANPAAFGGTQIGRFRISTSNPVLIPFDHVMDPGHILTFEMTVAASPTLAVDYFWSEEPTER